MRSSLSIPKWLSCFDVKRDTFAADEDFVRGWRTIERLQEAGQFEVGRLWNAGTVLFKADSVLCGNTLRGINFLQRAGFAVRAMFPIEFSRERVERLWRYALGRYTDERVELLSRLMVMTPSLYLVLEGAKSHARYPTALRLTDLKGEAAPQLRRVGTLRHALGEPQSALLSYVHTADEPADVIRELGLLFDDEGVRESVLQAVMRSSDMAAEPVCAQLLAKCRSSDLSLVSALSRVRAAVEAGTTRIDPLDAIIIEASYVSLKRQHRSADLFPSCEFRHWDARGSRQS